VEHATERAHRQRFETEDLEVVAERADDGCGLAVLAAPSEQSTDRLGSEPAQCVFDRRRRSGIEPLDVIEGDDGRRMRTERSQGTQDRDGDRTRLDRGFGRLLAEQHDAEHVSLGRRELVGDFVELAVEEVA
jgi:hypothetical protein